MTRAGRNGALAQGAQRHKPCLERVHPVQTRPRLRDLSEPSPVELYNQLQLPLGVVQSITMIFNLS